MGAAKDNVLTAAGVLRVQLVPLQETAVSQSPFNCDSTGPGGEIVMLSTDSDVRKPG